MLTFRSSTTALRIDKGIHRIYDKRLHAFGGLTLAKQVIKDRSHVRERLAGPGAGGDDEIPSCRSQLNRANLVPVETVVRKHAHQLRAEQALFAEILRGACDFIGRIELD